MEVVSLEVHQMTVHTVLVTLMSKSLPTGIKELEIVFGYAIGYDMICYLVLITYL